MGKLSHMICLPAVATAIACLATMLVLPTFAATVVLRSTGVARGPVLTLGDVADVQSGNASEVVALTTTPLGPAPRTTRFLRASEIRDRLAARGIDLHGIRFAGAESVEVGNDRRRDGGSMSATPPSAAAKVMASDIRDAIDGYLTDLSGHDHWKITLVAGSANLDRLAGDGRDLVISGGQAPWSGRQFFTVRRPGEAAGLEIAVKVVRLEMVAFARNPIPSGQLIRRSDIELRPYAGAVASQAVRSIEAAVGKEARRAIRADAMLLDSTLQAPRLVTRGETVSVYARIGGITVRKLAVAKQHGAAGDLIQVESGEDRERYFARVSGPRELEIYAIGTNADDLALRRTDASQR